jgi:hypothetical protein
VRFLLLLILIIADGRTLFCQDQTHFSTNYYSKSDIPLILFLRSYNFDSTKFDNIYENAQAISSTGTHRNLIRLDFISVEEETYDTVFSKSFSQEEIDTSSFNVDFSMPLREKIPGVLVPLPRLLIQAADYHQIHKISDTISVKLDNALAFVGQIISFDSTSITLRDPNKKVVKIRKEQLRSIKRCIKHHNIKVPLTCDFNNLQQTKFKVVKEIKVNPQGPWEWK